MIIISCLNEQLHDSSICFNWILDLFRQILLALGKYALPQLMPSIAIIFRIMFKYKNEIVSSGANKFKDYCASHTTNFFVFFGWSLQCRDSNVLWTLFWIKCLYMFNANIIVEAMAHAIWNIIKLFLNLLQYILMGNRSTTFHWGDKTQQSGLAYSNRFLSWYTLIKYTKVTWHNNKFYM
jgi:hypothetical protein